MLLGLDGGMANEGASGAAQAPSLGSWCQAGLWAPDLEAQLPMGSALARHPENSM